MEVPRQPETSKMTPKKRSSTPAIRTLSDLAQAYLAHLAKAGKSQGTCFSYGIELRTACSVLGAETPLVDLTPESVAAYFDSDRVTKTRDGRPKSRAGVAKTRRVLRLALAWAEEKAPKATRKA
jgi:hypothetical protein